MAHGDNMLSADALMKTYVLGDNIVHALDGVSLSIDGGEMVVTPAVDLHLVLIVSMHQIADLLVGCNILIYSKRCVGNILGETLVCFRWLVLGIHHRRQHFVGLVEHIRLQRAAGSLLQAVSAGESAV